MGSTCRVISTWLMLQDLIADTKPVAQANFVCSDTLDSCPSYDSAYPNASHDPVHNHMGAHYVR